MNIKINDTFRNVHENTNLALLIRDLNINEKGIAIAVNHTVISKNSWQKTRLKENDEVTIITATQGG